MEIIIGIVVVFVILIIMGANSAAKSLKIAKEKYYLSLEELKNDPSNADLKQRTLELGRIYSNLTRDSKGVTTVDEIVLMNDINAACAAASVNTSNNTQSIEERLNTLSSLLEKGLISESEYNERKKEILANI